MKHRVLVMATAVLGVLLVLLGSQVVAAGDLVIELDLPPADSLGTYHGTERFVIGTVTDHVVAETPEFLGTSLQATFAVLMNEPREDAVRSALGNLFRDIGLLADSTGRATVKVDVNIRRNRCSILVTSSKARYRSEVFLEFTFTRDESVIGTVLACGNSELGAMMPKREKVRATYQAGFDDAILKLLRSKTFAQVVGEGWEPSSASRPTRWQFTRIARDKFYGPSASIREALPRAIDALAGKKNTRTLFLQSFEYDGSQPGTQADLEFIRGYIPGAIQEHLQAFYPGAFEAIRQRSEWALSDGLVVTGDLLSFKTGSFATQVLIGFGAGKDKLDAEIVFKDGATAEPLLTVHQRSSNWGAGWQHKRGHVRDMVDQFARDIAYLLVVTMVPDYAYPEWMEVCFDDVPYPSSAPLSVHDYEQNPEADNSSDYS